MLWTKLHAITIIPTFIVFILFSVLLSKLLAGKSDRVRRIPLQIISVTLLVLEALKQYGSIRTGDYDLYFLPFHYCSLFLFVLPFHAFYNGRYKRLVDAISFGCCASMTLFMLVMPSIIYSDEAIATMSTEFISFHTVVFHNLVCLYFILALAMRTFSLNAKSDIKVIVIFLCGFQTVAAVISNVIEVNFHNMYRCNLAPVEAIRQSLVNSIGMAGQILYISAIFAGTLVFAMISYFSARFVIVIMDKLQKKA